MTTAMLQQAVVDGEFRDVLLENPAAFGVSAQSLPVAVEQLDQESLDFWTEGALSAEVLQCATTCSAGPLTLLCDGATK